MLAFGYGFMPPFLTYHRFDKDGRLVQSTEIPVGGPTMIHDFCVTRRYAIFMDLPIIFDMERAMQGAMPFRWSDDYPARLGVMPRNGKAEDLKWFDIKPCYVFHPMNAYDDGDTIIFDTAHYDRLWDKGWKDSRARLHRWTLDLKTGKAREERLDDRPIEFPRIADAKAGFKHRFGYAPTTPGEHEENFALGSHVIKFDLETGASETYDFGDGTHVGEVVHAPGKGGKDSGWLMGYAHNDRGAKSSLVVFDASNVKAGPVAKIALPQRVPYGFHGNWFAD
jgi:carotenoid cleavage dioxygenase